MIVNRASAILKIEALDPKSSLCVYFSAKIVIDPPACSKAAQKNTVNTENINTAIIRSRITLGAVFSAAAFVFDACLDSADGFKPIAPNISCVK